MNKTIFFCAVMFFGFLLAKPGVVQADNVFDTIQQGISTGQDAANLFSGSSSGSGGDSKLQALSKKIIQWVCWVAYLILTAAIIVQAIKMGMGHPEAIGGLIKAIIGVVITGAINWLVPWLIDMAK